MASKSPKTLPLHSGMGHSLRWRGSRGSDRSLFRTIQRTKAECGQFSETLSRVLGDGQPRTCSPLDGSGSCFTHAQDVALAGADDLRCWPSCFLARLSGGGESRSTQWTWVSSGPSGIGRSGGDPGQGMRASRWEDLWTGSAVSTGRQGETGRRDGQAGLEPGAEMGGVDKGKTKARSKRTSRPPEAWGVTRQHGREGRPPFDRTETSLRSRQAKLLDLNSSRPVFPRSPSSSSQGSQGLCDEMQVW
ncbi:hypothetical protein VTK73DRAFT_8169 [Phialemonium thermophilum]|uniref:Uncharacterized protein n=1 Tax=Phialemonium thermophilum TaxID=223376 RepID=A0ABR3WA28_9PEZI